MPSYRIIKARDWGAKWKRPPSKEKPEDPECYIHHTGGNPMSNMAAEAALLQLNAYAQNTKNYSFLDYDYLVHWEKAKDLYTIAEGRGEWMSAATLDRNELGEAVCVFGYFHPGSIHTASPNPGHLMATAMAIDLMIDYKLLAQNPEILGHHQNRAFPVPQTGCPGSLFIPHIPEVKRLLAELREPTIPLPLPGDDMANMSVIRFRFDGFAEQIVGFRAGMDTIEGADLDDDELVVFPRPSAALQAKIERELGRPLKPLA